MKKKSEQILMFDDLHEVSEKEHAQNVEGRTGTFVDNMKLPIHRWFRYSAGFSAQWVEDVIQKGIGNKSGYVVYDPFAGSGTTLLAADRVGVRSFGVEAHPFVARVTQAKLNWGGATKVFSEMAKSVLQNARNSKCNPQDYPELIKKCYDEDNLVKLDRLKKAWEDINDGSVYSGLTWLAITAILRGTSQAGTAQWQYILPNKSKKVVATPYKAFESQVDIMCCDMQYYQGIRPETKAKLYQADARGCEGLENESINLVITSPPYANNYDYADATRFEMTFWGEVNGWGDLHDAVRKHLVVSCSQHASKEKYILEDVLTESVLSPILDEIREVCSKLAEERLEHGGKKHYHTMVARYFVDMAKVWHELRRVCKPDAKICYVIGDSAPYGIYVPVDRWLGELAIAAGFSSYTFEKIRDRNIKWKNRKHRVPLHEGRLWIE